LAVRADFPVAGKSALNGRRGRNRASGFGLAFAHQRLS